MIARLLNTWLLMSRGHVQLNEVALTDALMRQLAPRSSTEKLTQCEQRLSRLHDDCVLHLTVRGAKGEMSSNVP